MFGDVIVTLPAAAAILLCLMTARAWRLAIWWSVLFAGGMVVVVLTKLAFIGWGIGFESLDFTGISGHAMRAGAVLPVIGYLLMQRADRIGQLSGTLLGMALALMIALSRVIVHAHSVSEAVSGAVFGLVLGLMFLQRARLMARPAINLWLVAIAMTGLFVASTGEPAPTQQMLVRVALALSGHACPFTRANWAIPNRHGCVHARNDPKQIVISR